MKTSLRFLFFLLMGTLPLGLLAQTQPKKAPVRKPSPTQSTKPVSTQSAKPSPTQAAKPATTQSIKQTPPANTPATNRANSEKLPDTAKTPATPTARPAQSYSSKPTPANPPATTRNRSGFGYEKGDNLLNVGVGLSSYYYGNPIGVSFEIGLDKNISVGGQLDYNSGNYGGNYYNNSRWRYTATYLGARGSYHFNRLLNLNVQKADLYAGVGLGYRTFRWGDSSYGSGSDNRSGLFFNYFLGGRYYFTNKVGAFAELGYTGLSSTRVGLTVKF